VLRSAIIAAALLLGLTGCTGSEEATPEPEPCLGSVQNCELPLAEVGLLGAHQAATGSPTQPSWVAPWTNLTLGQQLDRGVRSLWLEVRSGLPRSSGVQTDPAGPPPPAPPAPLATQAAARAAAVAASAPTGEAAAYLCAGPCEMGAVPLADSLREVDAWLVEQPRELVVLVVDDYSAAGQLDAALRDSMLDRRLITGEATPQSTVGDLLAGGQVLMLDAGLNATGESGDLLRPDWVDTTAPLTSAGIGSCIATGDGLLVVRHWRAGVAPSLSDAVTDNEQQAIAGRLSTCRAELGRLPGLLMLAFPEVGDGQRALAQVAGSG
jgi:hypothetical protein